MHPLITAIIKLKVLREMAIRMNSPYYETWVQMIYDQLDYAEFLMNEVESRCP